MILLLAGTRDGRELGSFLQQKGYAVLATAVSDYGKELLLGSGLEQIVNRRLNRQEMQALIEEQQVTAVIDATHPHAQIVSRQTIDLTEEMQIPYLRFERMQVSLPENAYIHRVKTVAEAAEKAISLGKRIFLTTGSKNLQDFLQAGKQSGACFIARVLPDPEVIAKCFSLGMTPRDIVAMQGPFSQALNTALYQQYQVDVVVSKESGQLGGTEEKIKTALALALPLVIIERPKIEYPCLAEEKEQVLAWLLKNQ